MNDAAIAFHALTFVAQRDEVMVGRSDTDTYVVLPADGAAALQRMTQGLSASATARWYEAEYSQPLDIEDFLTSLRELAFIKDDPGAPDAAPTSVRWQGLARVVFSPPALLCYLAVFTWWLVIVVRHPGFAPHPHQVFFSDSVVLVELLAVFGQLPWLFAHEASHALAGRRLGLPSRLGVTTRLYFIVFETRMNGLLGVAPRKRYLCFLAGMLLDGLAVCGLGLVGYALRSASGPFGLIGRLALALAFPIVTRIAYQFVLFLQTDIYYVIATALSCNDLHAVSRAFLGNRLWPLVGRHDRVVDEAEWTERDREVARWYAPLLVLGSAVLVSIWVLALIPIAVQMVQLLVQGLGTGAHDGRFWDRVAFLFLNVAQLLVLFVLARRGRREDARASTVGASSPGRDRGER